MTVAALIPDVEKLMSGFLRGHLGAQALGTRFVGKTPGRTGLSWVRVTQLDAGQTNTPDHLVEFYLQLDCYAGEEGGQPEANLLARTVRAILSDLPGVHSDGVVSGVEINGQARVPDTEFEPARERVMLTVTVWGHA